MTLHPTVTIVPFKIENGEKLFYLQTRWKPIKSPKYSGKLEFPVGHIDAGEDAYSAGIRELKEETNLDIVSFGTSLNYDLFVTENDTVSGCQPYFYTQILESAEARLWSNICFLCEVSGTVEVEGGEAKDPIWVTLEQLQEMANQDLGNFFVLHQPLVKFLVKAG